MKRGVVVECNDDFVTLLTPDGQFIKAKNKEGNYEVGAEISFFPLMDEREEAATRTTRKQNGGIFDYFKLRKARVGALSVLAIMVIMITFFPFINDDKVYAYMSIDINPSFEIGLDNQLKVISLEPLNVEAEKLLELLPTWENVQFDEVVTAIVAASKSEGYVYPGKEIVITTVINEEDKDVHTELEKNIDEIRASYETEKMFVTAIESDTETREKAQELGISTGKYIGLQEKAKATDAPEKDEIKSIEKQSQSQNSSSTKNPESNSPSLPNPAINKSQPIKETFNADTKEKLQEAKNKLQENSKNEKNQNENRQKQQNHSNNAVEVKKNEEKDRKDFKNNKDDRDDRDNREKWNDKDDRSNWNNRDKRNDRSDEDNRDKRNNQSDKDDRDKRNNQSDKDNRDKRNNQSDKNDRDKRNNQSDKNDRDKRNNQSNKDDRDKRNNQSDKDNRDKWNNQSKQNDKDHWNNRDRDDD